MNEASPALAVGGEAIPWPSTESRSLDLNTDELCAPDLKKGFLDSLASLSYAELTYEEALKVSKVGRDRVKVRISNNADMNSRRRARLSVEEILRWADAYHAQTGNWPKASAEPVGTAAGITWRIVDVALRQGHRGLPGGSSLARLLANEQGVRKWRGASPLTIDQILAWADAHYERTGDWPTQCLGAVYGAPGVSWRNLNTALRQGYWGLPKGLTVARLLAQKRGVPKWQRRNVPKELPHLTDAQILRWAETYHRRTGEWPTIYSGPVASKSSDTWFTLDLALRQGGRGLRGGSSLTRLLARRRGKKPSGVV
jgi:hypothetical protein